MNALHLTGRLCGKEINTIWSTSVRKLVPTNLLENQSISFKPGPVCLGEDEFETFYAAVSDYGLLADYFAAPGAAMTVAIPKISPFCHDESWKPISNFGPFSKDFLYTKDDLPALLEKILSYNHQP